MKRQPVNPKDLAGASKPSLAAVPMGVLWEIGQGMAEGARKYGPFNWRDTPIQAHVYCDATLRHLLAWWEREDIDPDSGVHHVTKAITSLMVLRDAIREKSWIDNRPRSRRARRRA